MEVSLVQGNIDQSIKWDPTYERQTLDAFIGLTLRSPRPHQGLVIWPETATPFFFQDIDDNHRKIVSAATDNNYYLLLGSPSYIRHNRLLNYMNSAFLVSPSGNIVGRYDKAHLVPFGEYVPLRSLLPFMSNIVVGISDFLPGKEFSPLSVGNGKIGVLICYEVIFPEISREFKNRGAGLLVNITNDAWYGRSSAPFQHLSMAVLRSVENRMFIARAANTGISAIISPMGEITAQTALFEPARLDGTVKFMASSTFYSRHGDLFVAGMFICSCPSIGAAVFKQTNKR